MPEWMGVEGACLVASKNTTAGLVCMAGVVVRGQAARLTLSRFLIVDYAWRWYTIIQYLEGLGKVAVLRSCVC